MKKITRIFTLVIAFLCLFTLVGCNKDGEQKYYKVDNDITLVSGVALNPDYFVDGYKLIGLYDHDSRKMYTVSYLKPLPKDDYLVVYSPIDSNLYPSISVSGSNFGGWIYSEEVEVLDENKNPVLDKNGQPVTELKNIRVSEIDVKHTILEAKMMSFGEAGLVALVCILIVFGMLALISGVLYLFRFITPKKVEEPKPQVVNKKVVQPRKALKLEDIQDEDMMAAALVATIDYHEETGEDVRVVSIKEIK